MRGPGPSLVLGARRCLANAPAPGQPAAAAAAAAAVVAAAAVLAFNQGAACCGPGVKGSFVVIWSS
jgi:hypothetical protein